MNAVKAIFIAAAVAIAAPLCLILLVISAGGGSDGCPGVAATQPAASSHATTTIPGNYLRLYRQAGKQYGVDWTILAGIGQTETDHGRSTLPGVHSGTNSAGAAGPMQFLLSTWRQYGDGGDIYDPRDAIPAAARYLRASGAPYEMRTAIFAYNHAQSYVDLVLARANRFAKGDYTTAGDNTRDETCDIPAGSANALGSAIVAYTAKLKGVPYFWGGESPNGFDCSGLVQYVYGHFKIRLPRTADLQGEVGTKMPKTTPISRLQPGDLVFSYWAGPAGDNGIGHVMIYAGNGQMIGAHATAVSVQPLNSYYRTHVFWYTRVTQLAKGSPGP